MSYRSKPTIGRATVAAIAVAASLSATPAAAIPTFFVEAGTTVSSDFTPQQSNDSPLLQVGPATASISMSGGDASGSVVSGSANASADYGSLHAFATASSTKAAPDLRAAAAAGSIAEFNDTFNFLPAQGVPMTVRFTLDLHGSLSAACASNCRATGTDAVGSGNSLLQMSVQAVLDQSDPTHAVLPPLTAQEDLVIDGPLALHIEDLLSVGATVGGDPTASATGDFSSTALFFVDVIGGGGTYSTDSGNSYVTPTAVNVPEPPTWAAFSFGLVLLITVELRRMRRRVAA